MSAAGEAVGGPGNPFANFLEGAPACSCLSLRCACKRKQLHAQTVRHEPGIKAAAPSDAPAAAEQAASDAGAAAPEGLGEAMVAAKEAAMGAAESVKDAAPTNPFAGFFGGGAMALGFHALTSSRAAVLDA